jgi:hypothetical protein
MMVASFEVVEIRLRRVAGEDLEKRRPLPRASGGAAVDVATLRSVTPARLPSTTAPDR